MSQTAAKEAHETVDVKTIVDDLVAGARTAMRAFDDADQARVDEAVTALAWAIYEPGRAEELARLAVE
ncbi:MAG: hypothetical protein QF654_11775, partial [Alphaproteobacteria bacterium]|nr:hypothetical protein [Alphaproteobacteria bacterium]